MAENKSQAADEAILPEEIVALRDLVKKIVREELLPLEGKYIVHPGQGMALRAHMYFAGF